MKITELSDVVKMTPAQQLARVRRNGFYIKKIYDASIEPSEAVQLAAVRQDGLLIQYIPNPSEAVQLAAVQQNVLVIQYIKHPSEAVQLAAVNHNGLVIKFIKNPSEAVQLAAVQQNGTAIFHILNLNSTQLDNADTKRIIMVAVLKLIKSNKLSDANKLTEYLNRHHVDWPELAVINRSLKAI